MAKAFVVIQNGNDVVDRVDSKSEAEARCQELLTKSPEASFEFGKLDKRMFTSIIPASREYQEEVY